MLPGFKSRLEKELKKASGEGAYKDKFPSTTFKFHIAPCKENYTAWLGGLYNDDADVTALTNLN